MTTLDSAVYTVLALIGLTSAGLIVIDVMLLRARARERRQRLQELAADRAEMASIRAGLGAALKG